MGPVSTEPPKAKQVVHVRPRLPQKPWLNPKPKHPTLVVPVTPIPSQNKANKHRYPVAANGKFLDIGVITEEKPQPQSTKSPKVLSGQEDSFCLKCSLECDDLWVFCPVCRIVIHKTCILSGCVCKYKPQ